MAFPSTLSTFNRPAASDRLNSPSHSALHNTVSSALGQVEAVLGLDGDSSVLGTIIGDLRSPGSGGGGHVQTAIKGGTGQTSYTKGDLIIATSSSVLSKLAVSSTSGEVLTIDINQASGMKWSASQGANKLVISNSVVSINSGQASISTVLFAASIAASTLGTSNAIRFTGTFDQFTDINANLNFRVNLGVNSIATISVPAGVGGSASTVGLKGLLTGYIAAKSNSSVQQIGYIQVDLKGNAESDSRGFTYLFGAGSGISSINSSSAQDLIITGSVAGTTSSIVTGLFIVEKIS